VSGEPWRPLSEYILKNPHIETHTIPSMYKATMKRDDYRTEYAELWNSTATSTPPNGELEGAVDVILSPVGPGVAPKIDTSKWWGYTSQWNLLNYPALVFPVDKVDVAKDGVKETHSPRNETDKENWELWEKHGAEGYKDAPISLQLVGRGYVILRFKPPREIILTCSSFEDEKVIQAFEIIQRETGIPFVE
jgi:amidase